MASENSSEEDSTKLCDPCSYGGHQKQAVSRCDECDENLCDSCYQMHHRLKATRSHELTPLSGTTGCTRTLLPVFMYCDKHSTEALNLFCINHNQIACRLCTVTLHRKCTMKPLNEKSEEDGPKKEATEFFVRLQTIISQIEKMKRSREVDKTKVEECSMAVKVEVEKFKVDILAWLDDLEKTFEEQLTEIERAFNGNIDSHIKVMDQILKEMKDIRDQSHKRGDNDQYVPFTLMLKNKDRIEQLEKIKGDMTQEIKPVKFHFHRSTMIDNLLKGTTELGQIFQEGPIDVDISFLDISSVTKRNKVSGVTSCVTGCTFMPDGKLVICDGYSENILKVLTPDFKIRDEIKLDSGVWDVSAIANDEIVVTGRVSKQLHFFDVSIGIIKQKTIDLGLQCYGIDHRNETLYVSFFEKKRREIKMITKDGTIIKTIPISQGYPHYVAVNNPGNIITTTTDTASTVFCFDVTGKILLTHSDSQLQCTLGLLFDNANNFLVCGLHSNNVHVVTKDGTKHKILLSAANGINEPCCLAYRPSDKTLIIGQRKEPYLLAFTIALH